LLIDVIFII